jgi:transposase-like protein
MPDQSKLTETTFQRIVQTFRNGGTLKLAALRAGISDRTLLRWFRAGRRKEDEACVSLLSAVTQAQADRADEYLLTVNEQAKTDGKLALEMLARLYPREYGSDTQRMKHIERRLIELEKKAGNPDA